MALYYLKRSGEFDVAVREWEAKPLADKMWVNIKVLICTEHARENKHNKLIAKQFRVNAMEEQVEALEELIATLTENLTCQTKTLIESTTDAMKGMMVLIKSDNKNSENPINATNEEKEKNRMRNARSIMKLRFVHIVERNIQPKKRMSVGNEKRTKFHIPTI
jgi:hypothetical protein